jgi:hypothetical protein
MPRTPTSYLRLARAFAAGYLEVFEFNNGCLRSKTNPDKIYEMHEVKINEYSCPVFEINLYSIETNDGIRGIAIILWAVRAN